MDLIRKLKTIICKMRFFYEINKLKSDAVVIDCGANVGDITEMMATKGAKVYSFEPNAVAFRHLQKRFENNTSVDCINKAVSVRQDVMKLYKHINAARDELKYSEGASLINCKCNIDMENYEEVEVVRLSEFIQRIEGRIEILKIDIEGEEYNVLNDLIDTKACDKVKFIVVETHEHKIPQLLDAHKALKKRIKKEKIHNIFLDWV